MIVQLTRARYVPDKIDEAQTIIQGAVLPAASRQPGFRGAYWAIERETGAGIGISFWETRADAEALLTSGFYQEQVAKVGPLLIGDVERELYELAAQV